MMYEITIFPKAQGEETNWEEIIAALTEGHVALSVPVGSVWVNPEHVYRAVAILGALGYQMNSDWPIRVSDSTGNVPAVEMLKGALRHLDDALHKIPADTWQWTHISAAKSLLQSVLRVLVFEAAGDSEE